MARSLKNNNICALYIRISREESGEHRHSIETQKRMLDKYCLDNNMVIKDYYIDIGVSGTTCERPGFLRMLDDIKFKRINTVIVKDLSRFGRNHILIGNLLEDEFIGKVRFISLSEGIDTANGYDETIPLINVINEYYSKDLSRKVKTGLMTKAKRERISSINGGFYGYKYKDGEKKLIIDDEAAKIVRIVFKMFLDGKRTKDIASYLNTLHVPTPGYTRFLNYKDQSGFIEGERGSKYEWDSRMIRMILKKYEYTGNTVQYKTTIIKRKTVNVPKEFQYSLKNTHPAIISSDEYSKAQIMMKHTKVVPLPNDKTKDTFTGMVFNDSWHKMTYVVCKNRKKYEYRARIGGRYGIKEDVLKEIVLNEMKDFINNIIKKENETLVMLLEKRKMNFDEKRLEEIKKKERNLNTNGMCLFYKKIEGKIDENNYKLEIEKINLQLKKVVKEKEELINKKINIKTFKASYKLLKNEVLRCMDKNIMDFAKNIIDKIQVIKSENGQFLIRIFYKFIG